MDKVPITLDSGTHPKINHIPTIDLSGSVLTRKINEWLSNIESLDYHLVRYPKITYVTRKYLSCER